MSPGRRSLSQTTDCPARSTELATLPSPTPDLKRPIQASGARCGLAGRWRTPPAPSEFQFPALVDLPKTKSRRRSPGKRVSRRKPRIRPATAPGTAVVKPLSVSRGTSVRLGHALRSHLLSDGLDMESHFFPQQARPFTAIQPIP